MKNIGGHFCGEDFLVDDDLSDTDSEVGGVFEESLEVILGPLADFVSSEDEDDEYETVELAHIDNSEEGEENVSLEGYFAFGPGTRRRISSRHEETPNQSASTSTSQQQASTSVTPAAEHVLRSGNVGLEDFIREAIIRAEQEGFAEVARAASSSSSGASSSSSSSSSNQPSTSTISSPLEKSITIRQTSATIVKAEAETQTMTEEEKNSNKSVVNQSEEMVKKNDCGVSESGESGKTAEDGEETCNPMVSDVEDLDENEDTLRGDRIGGTTYSERHVLKILMKWVQVLPKYSEEGIKEPEESGVDKSRFLENQFEEEMSLLWDMSFEPDVMNFLVQHGAFNIIRDTLNISSCDRLTEIGLGIMANIISQQSIIEDFSVHDASLKLVEAVISLAIKMPRVPVLIQVFAVLRRITWFLRNVALLGTWKELLLSHSFLNCTNFILSSSTNILLLGNVIVTLFSMLEALSPDLEKETDEDEVDAAHFFGNALGKKNFENFQPFCNTNFIPSLCEGLNELMKNPQPRKRRKMTSSHTQERDGGETTDERTMDNLELPIPDGHVQNAILNGLSSMIYLHKTHNGKSIIRQHYKVVFSFLIQLLQKFALCTDALDRSSALDYFSLTLNLLAFCHKQEKSLKEEGLKAPLVTAAQLMQDEQQDEELKTLQEKDGVEHDSKTFIALITHEYYASLSDNFGADVITLFKTEESCRNNKYKVFLEEVDKLVVRASSETASNE